jgi:hypothetical protein
VLHLLSGDVVGGAACFRPGRCCRCVPGGNKDCCRLLPWGPDGDHTVSALPHGIHAEARRTRWFCLRCAGDSGTPHSWGPRGRRFTSCRPDRGVGSLRR